MIAPKFADPQQQAESDRKRQMMAQMLITNSQSLPRHPLEALGNALQGGIGQRLRDPRFQQSAFPAAPGTGLAGEAVQNLRNIFGANKPSNSGGLW